MYTIFNFIIRSVGFIKAWIWYAHNRKKVRNPNEKGVKDQIYDSLYLIRVKSGVYYLLEIFYGKVNSKVIVVRFNVN